MSPILLLVVITKLAGNYEERLSIKLVQLSGKQSNAAA